MPLTCVVAEREMLVMLDLAKVAVSADPLGTMSDVQLTAVFQSPVEGNCFHVSLPAKALLRPEIRSKNIAAAARKSPNRERSDTLGGAMGLSVCAFIVFLGWTLF